MDLHPHILDVATNGARSSLAVPTASDHFVSRRELTEQLLALGLTLVPQPPPHDSPARVAERWHGGESASAIEHYFLSHPDHDLGILVDARHIIFEALEPESSAPLARVLGDHGEPPLATLDRRGRCAWIYGLPPEASASALAACGEGPSIAVWGAGSVAFACGDDGAQLQANLPRDGGGGEFGQTSQEVVLAIAQLNRRALDAPGRSGSQAGTSVGSSSAQRSDAAAPCSGQTPQALTAESTPPSATPWREPVGGPRVLTQYSLTGMSDQMEKTVGQQLPLLGQMALQGQATVIYAPPNSGKTLITLHQIRAAIRERRVEPDKLYYLNVDDTASGLLEKLRLAEEAGFHMVAEGHKGFRAGMLLQIMVELAEADEARGVVVILDTLKRFTDLMDKGRGSRFTEIVRMFVLKGGTVIALAHTNKQRTRDGRFMHAGTSDIVDDFDCAYVVNAVTAQVDTNLKTVVFENLKRRGDVALQAAYSYPLERGISYEDLLLSVREIGDEELAPIKRAADVQSDAEIIDAITACIHSGTGMKMDLVVTAAEVTKASRRAVLQVLERYTGDDASQHRWRFDVRARGAKVYALLNAATPAASG